MTTGAEYWPLWIRIAAYGAGFILFGGIVLYAVSRTRSPNDTFDFRWSDVLGLLGFCGMLAWFAAWREKRVVAAFAEWLVAYALPYGSAAAGAAVAYSIGKKVYRKTARLWLSWVVAVIIGLAVFGTIHTVVSKIPGIGWRIERIQEDNEEYRDYDHGRL